MSSPAEVAFDLLEAFLVGLALEEFAGCVASYADMDADAGADHLRRGQRVVSLLHEVREERHGIPLARWEDDGGAP